MKQNAALLLATIALAASAARAEVKLPALFSDNMVLQRDAKVAIWGTADPGEQVTVEVGLEGTHLNPGGALGSHWDIVRPPAVTADRDGRWRVELGPFPAVKVLHSVAVDAGFPPKFREVERDRLVRLTVTGKNTITLNNVLIGDVWVGSGQSNMQWSVSASGNAEEEIAAADHPKIRLFTVPRRPAAEPQPDVVGSWVVCDPKNVPKFSAVLYYFGRELHKSLDVPIGLIHSSLGGTPIEAWTARRAYESDPTLKPILERWDQSQADYAKRVAAIQATQPDAKLPVSPLSSGSPTGLYNAMIAPLTPYTIKGVAWYQGEANAGRAALYHTQMPALIADWRRAWGSELPFLQVQLANYKARDAEPTDTSWARLREAQLMTALKTPKVGLAVAIDIGDAGDIHPKNKQDVGKRLALAARAIAYGEKIVYSGPIYKAMKVEGNKVRLTFDHVGGGLEARGEGKPEIPVRGFAIAGEDRKFVWAKAHREGDDVVVWSDQVEKPVAVRYGWADNPDCNLYNKEGLPASPFRTDDWPLVPPPPPAGQPRPNP